MSRREKLIQNLLSFPTTMRFSEVKLIIESHGYDHHQPRGGSSHNIFRKPGREPISIPVHNNLVKRFYLKDVARKLSLAEDDNE